MFTKFKKGASNLVSDIVTRDETWIYCCDTKTKQQLIVWVYRDDSKPTKVACERSASKRMIAAFLNKAGHVSRPRARITRIERAVSVTRAIMTSIGGSRHELVLRSLCRRRDNNSSRCANALRPEGARRQRTARASVVYDFAYFAANAFRK
ncbi:hypothetical protein EVAR_40679_1 [Eumeta japonica]|uniref:Mariner Mos1 transposase n=1 Tax=Eumeta variegata TaxID=151549 RepID=A0A4C1XA90_EUMVA|nr:hypothetical protein EVAR_40679_1 [Eumeta japonica]